MARDIRREDAKEVSRDEMEEFLQRVFMYYSWQQWYGREYDVSRSELELEFGPDVPLYLKQRAMTFGVRQEARKPSGMSFRVEFVDYSVSKPLEFMALRHYLDTHLLYYCYDDRHLTTPVIREDNYDLTKYLDRWILMFLKHQPNYRRVTLVEEMLDSYGLRV